MSEIRIFPVEGMPEVVPGDDVAALIVASLRQPLVDGDVVVVAQKIVSKAEGCFVARSDRLAAARAQAAHVLRRLGDMIIAETRHGFVCANAGVDASNVPGERLLTLPADPDLSARRILARLEHETGAWVGVVVADTFGRAWRLGQTNVAVGVAGFDPFLDYRGRHDEHGRELSATRICIADELAAAAELVMGKIRRVPVAVVRGAGVQQGRGRAGAIVRPREEDLFR